MAVQAHHLLHPPRPEPGQAECRQHRGILYPGSGLDQLCSEQQGGGPGAARVRVPQVCSPRDAWHAELCQGQHLVHQDQG